MNNSAQIKLGALLSYISIGVNILAGLIYTPWMVQQIGQSQYGLFTLANSLITLFLVDFGLSSATARFVSNYHAENRQDKVDSFLGAIYKLYLFIDLIIFIALIVIYFLIDKIYAKLTPSELQQFKVVYVIAASYSLINFPFVTLNGILTAYEKFIQLKLADLLYRFLIVGLMILALFNGLGLYALVTVNAVVGLVIIIYKLIIIKKTTPVKVYFKNSNKSTYKEIFGFSIWTTITSLSQRLIFNITPSILGMFSGSVAIAVFGVVTTIESYAYTITSAINGMFMPKISRIYASNDEDTDIMPLMLKVGKFQFILNGLLVIGFLTVGKLFINLWMGKDYLDAYLGILLVIIPGMFFNSLQIANTAMVVKNKVKEQAIITAVVGVFNIICSIILSKIFGVIGACFSIFLAYSLRAILYHFAHKKILGVDIVYFIKKCYLRILPSIVITMLFGLILNNLIVDSGWLNLGLKAMLISAFYLIFVFVFGLTREEKSFIYNIFKR